MIQLLLNMETFKNSIKHFLALQKPIHVLYLVMVLLSPNISKTNLITHLHRLVSFFFTFSISPAPKLEIAAFFFSGRSGLNLILSDFNSDKGTVTITCDRQSAWRKKAKHCHTITGNTAGWHQLGIAGLHVTSWQPWWWPRTNTFLSSGNKTPFSC